MPRETSAPPPRRRWSAVLVAVVLAAPATARAQGMVEVMGAAAIQGSLNGVSLPSLRGAMDRTRQTAVGMNAASEARAVNLNEQLYGGGQGIAPPPAVRSAPSGPAPTSTARVNGRPVPTCSHGGLCHGALLRALGGG